MRTCERVEGCQEKHYALGFCGYHYRRNRIYGKPEAPPKKFCPCGRPYHAKGKCKYHYEIDRLARKKGEA